MLSRLAVKHGRLCRVKAKALIIKEAGIEKTFHRACCPAKSSLKLGWYRECSFAPMQASAILLVRDCREEERSFFVSSLKMQFRGV